MVKHKCIWTYRYIKEKSNIKCLSKGLGNYKLPASKCSSIDYTSFWKGIGGLSSISSKNIPSMLVTENVVWWREGNSIGCTSFSSASNHSASTSAWKSNQERSVSSMDKGNHSEQLGIDLQWFPFKRTSIPTKCLLQHNIAIWSVFRFFTRLCLHPT